MPKARQPHVSTRQQLMLTSMLLLLLQWQVHAPNMPVRNANPPKAKHINPSTPPLALITKARRQLMPRRDYHLNQPINQTLKTTYVTSWKILKHSQRCAELPPRLVTSLRGSAQDLGGFSCVFGKSTDTVLLRREQE